jgi:hypothetical protein
MEGKRRALVSWVREMSDSDKPYFWFEAAMISTFPGYFEGCQSNYEVETILRKAKVIRKDNRTDTESCALLVLFSNRKSGEKFIERLNKWLDAQDSSKGC